MIQNWDMMFDEKSQPILDIMKDIYTVTLLLVVLVILYFSYIGNCRMVNLFFFGQLIFCPNAFIIAIFPIYFSLIALVTIFVAALFSRSTKMALTELKKGILSSNPRYRKKEEKAFSILTEEEKEEWIKKYEKSQLKKVPLWVTVLVVFPPYLIGIAVTALIP